MSFLDKIFPPGKINLELEKTEFKPGETIRGTIRLETKKPVHARSLEAKIFCVEKSRSYSTKGASQTSSLAFEFGKKISPEMDYQTAEFPFEITIPSNALGAPAPQPDGAAAAAVSAISMVAGASRALNWFVEGKLDIPHGRDISKKVQINVV